MKSHFRFSIKVSTKGSSSALLSPGWEEFWECARLHEVDFGLVRRLFEGAYYNTRMSELCMVYLRAWSI